MNYSGPNSGTVTVFVWGGWVAEENHKGPGPSEHGIEKLPT